MCAPRGWAAEPKKREKGYRLPKEVGNFPTRNVVTLGGLRVIQVLGRNFDCWKWVEEVGGPWDQGRQFGGW